MNKKRIKSIFSEKNVGLLSRNVEFIHKNKFGNRTPVRALFINSQAKKILKHKKKINYLDSTAKPTTSEKDFR
jgi:hypothetical protein